MNVLIAVTGSVAGIKVKELASHFNSVKIITTENGKKFLPTDLRVLSDHDEWNNIGDSILHIELRKWADVLVVAPLSANTLAKFALGLCDNLVTSVFRAWDFNKPVILCPAMNTFMWDKDITYTHLATLRNKCQIIEPVDKRLACGDVGIGAMASIDWIVKQVKCHEEWYSPLDIFDIPVNLHPGAYGVRRKYDYHSGIDLYTDNGAPVYACQDGIVVHKGIFTGKEIGYPFWETTYGLMIEGYSGVINYGEIYEPSLAVGDKVSRGDVIGEVKRVLPLDKKRYDISGHNHTMLHLELYKHDIREFGHWNFENKSLNFRDPTPYLLKTNFRKILTHNTNLY